MPWPSRSPCATWRIRRAWRPERLASLEAFVLVHHGIPGRCLDTSAHSPQRDCICPAAGATASSYIEARAFGAPPRCFRQVLRVRKRRPLARPVYLVAFGRSLVRNSPRGGTPKTPAMAEVACRESRSVSHKTLSREAALLARMHPCTFEGRALMLRMFDIKSNKIYFPAIHDQRG